MTPQEVVDLCLAAYNGACALAGMPDLSAQLAAKDDAVAKATDAKTKAEQASADLKTAVNAKLDALHADDALEDQHEAELRALVS